MASSNNVPQGQDQSTKSVPCAPDVQTNAFGDTYSVPDSRPACAFPQTQQSAATAFGAPPPAKGTQGKSAR